MFRRILPLVLILSACTAQQDKDRIAQLEKQTRELQGELKKQQDLVSLDVQAKCSAGAKTYFQDNWGGHDPNQTLLTYSNHYNRESGKCFVLVESHLTLNKETGSWMNSIELTDAFEGTEYGKYLETHSISVRPKFEAFDSVTNCSVNGTKCKTIEEFNNLVRPFMQN